MIPTNWSFVEVLRNDKLAILAEDFGVLIAWWNNHPVWSALLVVCLLTAIPLSL